MKTFFYTIAFAALTTSTLSAQEPVKPTAPATKPAVIHKRKEIQQKRIANGVENGSLTAMETAKLEAREAHNNKVIATQRAANGGTLTQAQKRQAARRQNSINQDIAKQKHDAQTQK